jgi:hypothetical protein
MGRSIDRAVSACQESSPVPLSAPMKALFSDCGKYRYWLKDDINSYARLNWPISLTWIMLNPSVAGRKVDDKEITDPTNTRVRTFTADWGYTDYKIVNLFALVSTDPGQLQFAPDAIGPDNWYHCKRAILDSHAVVCAWGSHKRSIDLGRAMRANIRELGKVPYCLGQTQNGSPKHPLYLPKSTTLQIY